MTSGKLKKILMGLRENGEEKGKIKAFTQLCNVVCTDHVESLSTFHVDSFIPLLIGLLNQDKNPEVMLLAARALTCVMFFLLLVLMLCNMRLCLPFVLGF